MLRYVTGRRGFAGFTQFELLIVVGVGLIVTVIGLPRMTPRNTNRELLAN